MVQLAGRVLSGPQHAATWKTWWIGTWFVATATWIVYGLAAADFTRGASAFLLLFFPLELWGIRKADDAFPPLTHVIRHRFPKWVAMPLIFGTVAAVCSRWAALPWRYVGIITIAVGGLGWLNFHFIDTYAERDMRAFDSDRSSTAA